MMTEELTSCFKCHYQKALTHYDNSGLVNWVACPLCRTYFEFGKVIKNGDDEEEFWNKVEHDTGFKKGDKDGKRTRNIKQDESAGRQKDGFLEDNSR